MKTSFETSRLLLRELRDSDDAGLFTLDSDALVHQYLGGKPVTSIEQCRNAIAMIRDQYRQYGIGRWAVILKETGEFMGWSGLKVERNVNGRERFYDLGYRFIPKFWGSGYATEAGRAWVDFGFREMRLEKICAYTSEQNIASQRVLANCGLRHTETFIYEGDTEFWFESDRV